MKLPGVLASVLLAVGLLVLFTAEKVFGEGTIRDVLAALGGLSVIGALIWRVSVRGKAEGPAQKVETGLLAAYFGVALSLGLYALSTDWGLALMGHEGEAAEHSGGIFAVLWPAILVVSATALLFMEMAYRRMPVREAVELRRVRSAAFDGLSIALSLVFVASINFVAEQRDVKKDLSYFKTTHPSEMTLNMVESLGEPIKVVLFYPPVNEVLDQVKPYFEELDAASDNLEVEVKDLALAPAMARQHRIRDNGQIVLLKGEGESQQAETFEVGTDLEQARSRLRTLDGRFQQSYSRLTRVRRELQVTAGHDEHTAAGAEGDTPDQRISGLNSALERSNIRTQNLGMAQGLANRVPDDAPAVAVIGPRKPFMPEEAQALLRYVEGGGRLVVMVDPDTDHGLDPLLKGLGVSLLPGKLCSERQHYRRTFTDADRAVVYSNRYTSHPTVTLVSRNASQVATVFVEGGAIERHEGSDVLRGAQVSFPLRTTGEFWRDLDGDYTRDDGEALEQSNMMAVVTVPAEGDAEGRAVIIADGDFITDQVVRNPGNALIFGDVLQWFLGEEQILGDTTSEEDILIEHTQEEDKIWFWATSFGAPLPLFGIAIWVATRRRKPRRPRKAPRGAAGSKRDGGAPDPKDDGAEPAEAAETRGHSDSDEGEDDGTSTAPRGDEAKGAATAAPKQEDRP